MNERYKLPIPLAALFAFVAFGGGFATTFMIIMVGGWRLRVEQAANYIGPYGISENQTANISFFVAIGVAAFVFRFLRSKISPNAVFHLFFLSGLSLLAYSIWIMAFIIRLLNSDLEKIDKMFGGWLVVADGVRSILFILLWTIPAALLLLAFATIYDKRMPHKRKCQPS